MTDTRFDVVALGNAIVDVIAPVDEAFISEWNIERDAMSLIDEPRAQALTGAAEGKQHSGGSAANTAAGIASFGGKAGYLGKVADDALGNVFRADMKVFVTPDGSRSMNTFLGATVMFSPEDVDKDMVAGAGLVYLEGYLFDRDEAKASFVHAAEIARAAGRKVSLTLSDSFCVDRHRDSFRHLIKNHVDVLFANEAELLALYQTDDFDSAVAQLREDSPLAAVTRGEHGSVVIADGQARINVPAEPIDKVIDTTGAGDQYAAGFLFGLSRDLPLETCAKLGHIAAAEVISHYGPRPETSYAELAAKAEIAV